MRGKIKGREDLGEITGRAKAGGKKVVFTNGCFDLIHVGHTRYLEEARGYGDILIVAVNNDSSVRTIKGDKRPIMPEDQRAEVVASLGCVDYVTIFSEPDPYRLISYLRPDVLVKGGDWSPEAIIGRDVVEGEGGKVVTIPVIEGAATTNIVQKVLDIYLEKAGKTGPLEERARSVRLLIVDVDGVLTDGRILFTDSGEEIKAFNVRDGHGIRLLMREGIEVAFLTGRRSRVAMHRARDLGIEMVYQGAQDKLPVFEGILTGKGLSPKDVCYIGDDLVDLEILKRVGLSVTVPDAPVELKGTVDYVTRVPGGKGAVREVCELILKAQGKWNKPHSL